MRGAQTDGHLVKHKRIKHPKMGIDGIAATAGAPMSAMLNGGGMAPPAAFIPPSNVSSAPLVPPPQKFTSNSAQNGGASSAIPVSLTNR